MENLNIFHEIDNYFDENKLNFEFKSQKKDLFCIFDLDGVITKTTEIHFKAWKKAFTNLHSIIKKPNIKISKKHYLDIIDGAPRLNAIEKILTKYNIFHTISDIEKISKYKNDTFLKEIRNRNVPLYPDALKLIKSIRNNYNSKIAIATSSKNGHEIVKKAKINHLFDFCITGIEVDQLGLKPKPSPDIFLYAMQLLNAQKKNVYIFEDSSTGLRAALKTGCANVVYADRNNNKLNLKYHHRLSNLYEINFERNFQ